MSIVTREEKGSRLTIQEMDGNFNYLYTASLGGGYEEVIVNISSAQILAMGDTPIELLPAPGENKYYDIEKIVFEYTFNSIPYEGARFIRMVGGYESSWLSGEFYFDLSNGVLIHNSHGDIHKYDSQSDSQIIITRKSNSINESISLQAGDEDGLEFSASNPTNGDGALRAIIKYKVRTFGE
jgi:hypothetical protein